MRIILSLLVWALFSLPTQAQQTGRPCHTSNGSNCIPEFGASASIKISNAAASTTEIIAAVTNKSIYITHYNFMATNTNNVKLVYGTGTNCGTGTTDITGAYPLIAQAGVSAGIGLGAIAFVPVSNALCITASGSSLVAGLLSYVQY